MGGILSAYNNLLSKIVAHYQAKERGKGIKCRKGSKKKVKEDLKKGEMMGFEVAGILKFRPTDKYRDMQNKSCLGRCTSGAFC